MPALLRYFLYIFFLGMGVAGKAHGFGENLGQAIWAVFVIWICFKIERACRRKKRQMDVDLLADAIKQANSGGDGLRIFRNPTTGNPFPRGNPYAPPERPSDPQ